MPKPPSSDGGSGVNSIHLDVLISIPMPLPKEISFFFIFFSQSDNVFFISKYFHNISFKMKSSFPKKEIMLMKFLSQRNGLVVTTLLEQDLLCRLYN